MMASMQAPLAKHHDRPTAQRTRFFHNMGKLPVRGRLNALRMLALGLWGTSLSQGESALGDVALDPIAQRRMRWFLFKRGMLDDNAHASEAMARAAQRVTEKLRRTGRVQEPQEVPRFDLRTGDPAELYERYVRLHRPVLLEGYESRSQSWTVEWLIENYGDRAAPLKDTDGVNYDGKIRDLLDVAPNGETYYLLNYNDLLLEETDLRQDLGLEVLAPLLRRSAPRSGSLFVGMHKGSGTRLHCAGNFNTFLNLEGVKRWTLVDPRHVLLTYPYLSHTNNFHLTLIEDAEVCAESDRWPLFRYCPRYQIDLQPGDCLIVPTWWLHGIRNLTERTMGIALRWDGRNKGDLHPMWLFEFLERAALRLVEGNKGAFQDNTELVGTASARACWGLEP